MNVSKLTIYGIGIVAVNKALNSNQIEVTPIEDLTMLDGEITDNVDTYSAAATNSEGENYDVEAKTSVTINATWLPVGQSNRMTSPDVRRGEQVMLYRFADSDMYYWNTLRNDLRFRKLETVVFGISATKKEDATPNESNTYVFEVSTHKKFIRLHTSQDDKEPFGYDIKLDTGNGVFTFEDTIGNKITLTSEDKQIRLENASGNYIDLIDNVLNISTNETINIKTAKTNIDSSELININTPTLTIKTDKTNMTASKLTIKAQTFHDGNFLLGGNLGTTKGSGGGGGDVSMEGKATVQNGISTPADVTVGGTVHASYVDAPNVN